MPITPEQAAEVAAAHDLEPSDAAQLLTMASDLDQAQRIARQWEDPMRRTTRNLFARTEAAPTKHASPDTPPNHVPTEGGNPRPTRDDQSVREFTRDLFARDYWTGPHR